MDLLIAADWEQALDQFNEIEEPEPVLTSVMPVSTSATADAAAATGRVAALPQTPIECEGDSRSASVVRFLLPVFMIGLLLAVAVGSVVILRRAGAD